MSNEISNNSYFVINSSLMRINLTRSFQKYTNFVNFICMYNSISFLSNSAIYFTVELLAWFILTGQCCPLGSIWSSSWKVCFICNYKIWITISAFSRFAHKSTLENTKGQLKKGQSRETGNIGYTRRRKKPAT
jgi:hypothetical protein